MEGKLSLGEAIGLYAKVLVAALVAGLNAYIAATPAGVSATEWIATGITVIVALGVVWAIPLTPAWLATYGKALFGGLVAAGGSITPSLMDGSLTTDEVLKAIVAFILATGITGVAPNASASDPVDPATGKQVAVPAATKAVLASPGVTTTEVTSGVVVPLTVPANPVVVTVNQPLADPPAEDHGL